MSNQGWIKLYRQIRECDIWLDGEESFDRRSAWIDLLLSANHKDKQIIFDGKIIIVGRGQYVTSVRKLASRWGWGNQKTLKYLRLLEELGMITKESDNRRTLLTIVNYEVFQSTDNTDGTETERSQNADRTQTERKSTTNKNEKNEKNEKNNIGKATALLESLLADRNISEPLADKLHEWIAYKCERKEGYVEMGMKSFVGQMEKKEQKYGSIALIECIDECMSRQYQGVIDDLIKKGTRNTSQADYMERWKNA